MSDILFNFLLPTSEEQDTTLYYREKGGTTALFDRELHLSAGATVSLDCYHNVFDPDPWLRHTPVREIEIDLSLRGDLTIGVHLLSPDQDGAGCRTIPIKEVRYQGEGKCIFSLSLEGLPARGTLFLSLSALEESVFAGGGIRATIPPLRDVKVGVVTTTFRREKYVKKNISVLRKHLPKEGFSLFVVDNGGTLTEEDVVGATLLTNRNLGGSGGFTRGILAVLASDCTHVLLADDDVSFDPEVFLRTAALARYLKEPDHTMIGASMLCEDRPYLQHESGARWTKRGVRGVNASLDLRDPSALLRNATHPPVDYTAWWFCCFSTALPRRIGLPFPFFIKSDDVEYGLRAGCEILLLNGIGVRHQSFSHKLGGALEYYALRNELTLRALRKRGSAAGDWTLLLRALARALLFRRYDVIPFLFRAASDFLQGADFFIREDGEALHRALQERESAPLTKAELEARGYDLSRPFHRSPPLSPLRKVWRALTLNGYLLPSKKGDYRLIDPAAQTTEDYYRAPTVLSYDPLTRKGQLLPLRRSVLLRTGCRALGYLFKFLFHRRKAARSLRRRFPDLISESAWRSRLAAPQKKKRITGDR